MLGAFGSLIAPRAWGDADEVETATSLPGKKALIRRSFRPLNYETPLADLAPLYTANEAFFVRYHLAIVPALDAQQWRLTIAGSSVKNPLTLSLKDLKSRYEAVTVAAVNQCSGNRRGLFSPRVPGVQWGSGAVGNALWKGVRLRELLRQAGLAADALEVWLSGADRPVLPATPVFQKSLPLERALDENVLVAYEMNHAPLPHWNGAPARLIVPGWLGTYWMKHLTEVRVEPKPLESFWMKAAYRVPAGAFPGAHFASQDTPESVPVTEVLVNSMITSHASGSQVPRGKHVQLGGKAWDGGAGIEAVEISIDGQRSWQAASLGKDVGRYAWREFSTPLDTARAGTLAIAVRARSRNGAQQPRELTFNPSGYHNNIVQTLRLEVA
jgi:DMSO/TMAO reductase YedYZ molybdopterin-dependent catalytic subunit